MSTHSTNPKSRASLPLPRNWKTFLSSALFLFSALALLARTHVTLFPQLKPNQSLQYEAHGRLDRTAKTESRVSSLLGPQELRGTASNLLHLTVNSIHPGKPHPSISFIAEWLPADHPPPSQKSPSLSFTIAPDGHADHLEGLDAFPPEQQLLWQFWLARFAVGWTLPPTLHKPGDKWKIEEPESTPAPISQLYWEREITYVRDDICPALPAETCAVLLSHSTLKQKSSPKDSTPEDYRRHDLKTLGTANGTSEVITYISLKSGLVLRASEDSHQSMEVTVLKADGSNGVHYDIEANSHFETLLVPPTPSK